MPTDIVRCAEWSRREAIDPIGTAGTYSGYLLLEWPLPWPADLGDVPELAPVVAALRGTGIRLQGLVATGSPGWGRHAVLYRRTTGAGGDFAGFDRAEAVVEPSAVVPTALALVEGTAAVEPSGAAVVDLLVCGHGRRDRCCGSLGTKLATQIADGHHLDPGRVRLWRTSHTGGHRFAPTMVVLPEGTVWGFADDDLVGRLVRRSGPLADVLARYRGCAGLASAPIQALERAVFAELGWPLLSSARRGEEVGGDMVRLHVADPAGASRWEARVTVGRRFPVPGCGEPLEDATKTGVELEVTQLRRI